MDEFDAGGADLFSIDVGGQEVQVARFHAVLAVDAARLTLVSTLVRLTEALAVALRLDGETASPCSIAL